MAKVRWGSPRAFAEAAVGLIGLGLLAELASRPVDLALRVVLSAFVLCGSLVMLVRAWRKRDDPHDIQSALKGGQLGVLPPTWRRWIADHVIRPGD